MKTLILSVLLCFYVMAQNNITIQDLSAVYEENAIHMTWKLAPGQIAQKYHIFYAEAQRPDLLGTVLQYGMTYQQALNWNDPIGIQYYDQYYYVVPKHVFPPYSSLIRLGVIAEYEGTYSKLFLVPDIVNKTPQRPLGVSIK